MNVAGLINVCTEDYCDKWKDCYDIHLSAKFWEDRPTTELRPHPYLRITKRPVAPAPANVVDHKAALLHQQQQQQQQQQAALMYQQHQQNQAQLPPQLQLQLEQQNYRPIIQPHLQPPQPHYEMQQQYAAQYSPFMPSMQMSTVLIPSSPVFSVGRVSGVCCVTHDIRHSNNTWTTPLPLWCNSNRPRASTTSGPCRPCSRTSRACMPSPSSSPSPSHRSPSPGRSPRAPPPRPLHRPN